MHIIKTPATPSVDPALLEQLNRFTRREHTAEEVYLFDVLLCDNEVDRDLECFSLSALEQLQKLFVGKTGIFDHNPTGSNQTARLFATRLETDPTRKTASGTLYTCLKGNAYMIRTDANQDLIREIDGGIKKEVSISCSAKQQTCSVCGQNRRVSACGHIAGKLYAGKPCHTILSEITDAYEWSFVAIPAQVNAGVTKRYNGSEEGQLDLLRNRLDQQSALLAQAETAIRSDIIRLGFLAGKPEANLLNLTAKHLAFPELLQLQEQLRNAVSPAGKLQIVSEEKALSDFQLEHYEKRND